MVRKIIIIITLILFTSIFSILYFNYKLEIKEVKIIDFNNESNELTIEIVKKNNIFNKPFYCTVFNNNIKLKEKNKKNSCTLKLKIGNDYSIILEDEFKKSKTYNILDFLDNVLEFEFIYDTIFLAPGESKKIEYKYKTINGKIDSFNLIDNVININDDIIVANEAGTKEISRNNKKMNVIVTDLIMKPTIIKNKQVVPCNKYTEDDAKILDNILEYKVKEAGYKTRAGAVAAARFLTLQFPYRIPYFYENGRLKGDINIADGEGRYYHKGLYLHENKKKDIVASVSGPCIWGCPLLNWEDDPDFGYIWGQTKPNGLDCSGFVTWALYNGGYDVGDVGAGETPRENQLTDKGEFTLLTNDLIYSNKIKVGDFFNYWGHITIIVGIDDKNFYVAESLQNFGGVVVNIYPKATVNRTFNYVVLMDNYYQNDGNYTEYWQ